MAAELNLTIEQGATYSRTCALQNAGATAYDLTGCTIEAEIRSFHNYATGSTADESFTITYTNRAGGLFTISLSATETAEMTVRQSSNWDMVLTEAAGTKVRCLQGGITMTQGITQ